jgi:hypothetical protein
MSFVVVIRERVDRQIRIPARDLHAPIIFEDGAGQDKAAHDHVLLETAQVVDLVRLLDAVIFLEELKHARSLRGA